MCVFNILTVRQSEFKILLIRWDELNHPRQKDRRMKQGQLDYLIVIIVYLLTGLVLAAETSSMSSSSTSQFRDPVELELEASNWYSNPFMMRFRRELTAAQQRQQCHPDPRSPHLNRRSICPFEIQRDTNPLRIPDVILRAHCLCESSTCSHQSSSPNQVQPARCVSLISPLKVAYLDPQLRSVVSTEVVHVPVACICATQPPGRHMPQQRNIVV